MTSTGRAGREQALVEAFVGLADTLVADYDVNELPHRLSTDCVDLLSVDAAGLLLSDQRGAPAVASYSTDRAFELEQFQLSTDEGCFRRSTQVVSADLDGERRWPRFTPFAQECGYWSVHAFPPPAELLDTGRPGPGR